MHVLHFCPSKSFIASKNFDAGAAKTKKLSLEGILEAAEPERKPGKKMAGQEESCLQHVGLLYVAFAQHLRHLEQLRERWRLLVVRKPSQS